MEQKINNGLNGEEFYKKGQEYLNCGEFREALQMFLKAEKAGHMEAVYQLGCLYKFAEPAVMKNYRKAFFYFEKCAKCGYGLAQIRVADCYLLGEGVDNNVEEAFKYYLEASQQNYLEADIQISKMYEHGIGVKKNIEKAIEYIKLAEQKGFNDFGVRYIGLLAKKGHDEK